MCCRKNRNYGSCYRASAKPQGASMLASALTSYIAARTGPTSGTKDTRFLNDRQPPTTTTSTTTARGTNMTLRTRKEEEAASESAKPTATTGSVPNEPPPAYQEAIAEMPATASSPRVLTRVDSDPEPEEDSDRIMTPQQSAEYIPGDHKQQTDADLPLPLPLQGTLSAAIQAKVDALLGALEAYRNGTGRRLPVKRARRDLLNQLYEDQIKNQESATGTRLRGREKAVIWKDLSGLRDEMWVMVRDAKRARKQWA